MEEKHAVNPLAIKILLDDSNKRNYDLEYKLALRVIQANDFTDKSIYTDALAIIEKYIDVEDMSSVTNIALSLLNKGSSNITTHKLNKSDIAINKVDLVDITNIVSVYNTVVNPYPPNGNLRGFYNGIRPVLIDVDPEDFSFEKKTIFYLMRLFHGTHNNKTYTVIDFLQDIDTNHKDFKLLCEEIHSDGREYHTKRKYFTPYVDLFITMKQYLNGMYDHDEPIYEFIDNTCNEIIKLHNQSCMRYTIDAHTNVKGYGRLYKVVYNDMQICLVQMIKLFYR